ncbi:MAG TPA: helix-turn-helix transcriptional regulator [Phycicoccus sp.]
MTDLQGLPEKYAPQLARARARLSVPTQVGLALREHRRRLRMSQRAYARARGLHRSMLARLEAGADHVTLAAVIDALDGTGFALYVGFADPPEEPPPAAAAALAAPMHSRSTGRAGGTSVTGRGEGRPSEPVPPEAWAATDLVARVRGGGRRFPAHRVVRAVDNPPMWWWVQEFFAGPSEPPQWYAPVMDGGFLAVLPEAAVLADDAGAA